MSLNNDTPIGARSPIERLEVAIAEVVSLTAQLAEAQRNKAEQARHCQELTAQLIEARELLRAAKCPQCDGSGVVEYGLRPVCCGSPRGNECCGDPIGEPEIGPCQWCDERSHTIDRVSTGEAG